MMNADPEEGLCIFVTCAFALYWVFQIDNIWLLLAAFVAVAALFTYLSVSWMDAMDHQDNASYEAWSRKMNEQADRAMKEIGDER